MPSHRLGAVGQGTPECRWTGFSGPRASTRPRRSRGSYVLCPQKVRYRLAMRLIVVDRQKTVSTRLFLSVVATNLAHHHVVNVFRTAHETLARTWRDGDSRRLAHSQWPNQRCNGPWWMKSVNGSHSARILDRRSARFANEKESMDGTPLVSRDSITERLLRVASRS